MAGRHTESRNNLSIAIVVAIILVASAFVLLRDIPERVLGVSADGLVSMTGLTRSSGVIQIKRIDDVETSVAHVASPVYEISLTQSGGIENGELKMRVEDVTDLSSLSFYLFDRSVLNWIALPTDINLEDSSIFAPLNFSGSVLIVVGAR